MEANTPEELERIKADLQLAMEWANKHFRSDLSEEAGMIDKDGNLVPPHSRVEVLAPDKIAVTPMMFGQALLPVPFIYRVHFKQDGGLTWEGRNPLNGSMLPPLVVRESPITKKMLTDWQPALKAWQERMEKVTPERAFTLGSLLRHRQ